MAKPSKTGVAGDTAIRTAEMLIARDGAAGALDFARRQLARLRDAGTADSAQDWAAIVRAIEELAGTTPKR